MEESTWTKGTIAWALLLVFLVGVAVGYGWRVVQVEPIIEKEIALLEKEVELLKREHREALGMLEAMKAQKAKKEAKR